MMKKNAIELSVSMEKLPNYGENTAAELRIEGRCGGRAAARILRDKERALEQALREEKIQDASAREWIRDNLHVLRRDTYGVITALRRAREMRKTKSGLPLIFHAAKALVRSGSGEVGKERLCAFLEGFQRKIPLEERELSLLSEALRWALIGELQAEPRYAEAVFRSLRWLQEGSFSLLTEQLSAMDAILRQDPVDIYPKMDEESRWDYRRRLAALAHAHGLEEVPAAWEVLERAKAEGCHVGELIYSRPLGRPGRKKPYAAYLAVHILLPLALALALGFFTASPAAFFLALLPLRDGTKNLTDRILTRCVRPRRLPRLDYSGGIPAESRTLAVSALLLTDPEQAAKAAQKLELYRLANREAGENLLFGLLADLPEGGEAEDRGDEEILRAAASALEKLNRKYGGGFCLLTRPRAYSERDKIWRPRERKRGAIMDLTALLRGEDSPLVLASGDKNCIGNIRFLIVLDGDTSLNLGAAARLAGTLAHPLQTPVADPASGRVRKGYAILQPKVSVSLRDAERSDFARIFAGQGGLDPYGSLNSDVYQDVFGEGSYSGKGILDVDAFHSCLKGRFPPETLLSHDLIEGSYVGCAYLSDITLTDGFPASLLSYFERQHRWVRGDWQTLPWLFSRVKNEAGHRERNPLSPLAKWKILDNLCRSLTPVAELLTLLLWGFFPSWRTLAVLGAVLGCLMVRIVFSASVSLHPARRYRARVLSAARSDFRQFLWLLLLLPFRAWVQGSAAVLALFRSFISHRKLLNWVTASEGDRRAQGGLRLWCRRMWACFALGLLALFAPAIPLRALGLLWLVTPFLSRAISRPKGEGRPLREGDRLFLTHCAGEIFRYFEELVTPERHFLPPDNLQETPRRIVAERTSPTNIGLYLLSCLAAADLGLREKSAMWRRMEQTVSALEKLPKCRGHLYNWYDVRSGEPLQPPFISTVDSGNLLACLSVIVSAAEEDGEEELARAIRALMAGMPLDFLYDARKGLLRIGWDGEKNVPAGGWYDLLESEARLASYLAVARGEAPGKHWRRLGRVLADEGGMSGLASWTGTMFEYLLPAIFLPSPQGSLLAESQEFCLHLQRRTAPGGVWGMSESAFGEMDAAENYAYKAHGVQGLALRPGMDREAVVSPYATFLALAEAPRAAMKNLYRLRRLGAEGTFGFYEALDFTPGRVEEGEHETVRCFMSHHLGMSMAAIDNCLREGILQKRFLREPALMACRELLEERTPVGERIRPVKDYRADEKPPRSAVTGTLLRTTGIDRLCPALRPLCGGRGSLILSETGQCRGTVSLSGGEVVTPYRELCFFADLPEGLVSLQSYPDHAPGDYSSAWDGTRFTQSLRTADWDFEIQTTLPPAGGELRRICISNNSRSRGNLTLVIYLEPVLCPARDYDAHPAFHRLCLESEEREGVLLFSHREGGSVPPCSLAVAASERFTAETDKALALGRGGLRGLPAAMRNPATGVRAAGEPCALLRISLSVRAGENKTVVLAFACEEEKTIALASAKALLRTREESSAPFRRAMSKLEDRASAEEAVAFLTPLLVNTAEKRVRRPDPADRSIFWRFGISGDLPVAAAGAEEAEKMLTVWAFLRAMGVPYDLAIHTGDEGVYGRPAVAALRTLAARLGVSGQENKPGGFHLVGGSREELAALRELADAREEDRAARRPSVRRTPPFFLPADAVTGAARQVEYLDSGVSVSTRKGIGRRAWSHLLTNGSLGWIATDGGSNCLWLDNARENRLTHWENDPLAIHGPETLSLLHSGRELSLFADGDEHGTEVFYGFGWIRWTRRLGETETETVGFISVRENRRYLLLHIRGAGENDRIRYSLRGEKEGVLSVQRDGTLLSESVGEGGEHIYDFAPSETLCIAVGPGANGEISASEAAARLEETRAWWEGAVGALRVSTPSPALDRYLNGWVLYQTLACRLLGRSSLYQSGGAYGFRDQLQDVCSLIDALPDIAREHIRRSAAHQYPEGDVMHWWHPRREGDKGVRTRCSDDLLWLPYACTLYVEKTGDDGMWASTAPWRSSPVLREEEKDRYETPEVVGEDSLLTHCERALELVEKRGTGPHGLLKMGAGDWNDGFDRVGGESVWLTWFAALVFERFGKAVGQERWRTAARTLGRAAEATWRDGQYLRGYYADGRPLGASGDGECALDSIAQSFAVLSGFGDPSHSHAAVVKAADLLLDPENRLVKLFSPPFDGASDPGYIRAYLPGVRENGGQYTHAALWLAAACLRCGETERGWHLLAALLPSEREEKTYQTEPFVLSADVYANPDMIGRGGWSWYTGAAGWFLRTSVEELLGVRVTGGVPEAHPNLPASWPGFTLRLRVSGADWHITCGENGTEVKKI